MVVTLIGYRGTGKTSVAPPLARRLGFTALDADTELDAPRGPHDPRNLCRRRRTGLSREESGALGRAARFRSPGAGRRGRSRPRSRDAPPHAPAGPVVWLRARIETIERQIAADPTTRERRPNLMAGGGRPEIETLLAVREPLYRETASVTVDVDGRPLDEIVAEIAAALPPHLSASTGASGSARS